MELDRLPNLQRITYNVPSIRDLYQEFWSEKIWIQRECPKVLTRMLAKLRFVNLDNLPEECDIASTMFLLDAAPSLEELCITVWDHKCQRKLQKNYTNKMDVNWEPPSTLDFKHKNLARLTIYGFQPNGNFMGYIKRVIQVTVNIKEVSLHDKKVCNVCGDKFPHLRVPPPSYRWTSEEVDYSRKKIIEAKEKVDSLRKNVIEVINAKARGRVMAMATAHMVKVHINQ